MHRQRQGHGLRGIIPAMAFLPPTSMRTAVYSGTFDPFTLGHEDVVRRASGLFDQLIVAVAGVTHFEVPPELVPVTSSRIALPRSAETAV